MFGVCFIHSPKQKINLNNKNKFKYCKWLTICGKKYVLNNRKSVIFHQNKVQPHVARVTQQKSEN